MAKFQQNQKYNELISLIYQASLHPDLWSPCLGLSLEYLGVEKGVFSFAGISKQKMFFQKIIHQGIEEKNVDAYVDYYRFVDPYVGTTIIHKREGDVGRGEEIIDVEDLMETEFYKDFLKPQGLLYSGSGVFAKDINSMGLISVFSQNKKSLTDEQLEKMQSLLPHFKVSFKMHQQIGDLVAQKNAFTDSLEHMPYGILLITEEGKVIFENKTASKIFEANDGLVLTSRGPIASDPRESRKLSELINHATPKTPDFSPHKRLQQAPSKGGILRISRPSGLRSYEIMAIPLRPKELAHGFTIPLLMLLLTDPELEQQTNEDVLMSLYNLTYAEAEVALLLMQGHTPNSIQGELGIEISTVRTHMRKVFTKTQTTRQADLVRLLLRGMASVQNSKNLIHPPNQ